MQLPKSGMTNDCRKRKHVKDAYDAFEEYLDETWWEEDCEVEDNMLDTGECKKNIKDKFDISSYIVVSKSKAKKVNSTESLYQITEEKKYFKLSLQLIPLTSISSF